VRLTGRRRGRARRPAIGLFAATVGLAAATVGLFAAVVGLVAAAVDPLAVGRHAVVAGLHAESVDVFAIVGVTSPANRLVALAIATWWPAAIAGAHLLAVVLGRR
jgi:hypothetical protein